MIPLLLLLLFAFPIATTTELCNDQKACMYFITCYDETKLSDSSRMIPTFNETTSLVKAVETKLSCPTFGFISTLSIEPISPSLFHFSFETDQRNVSIIFGVDNNTLQFSTNDNGTAKFSGISQAFEIKKSNPEELLGYARYSFDLRHPDEKDLHTSLNKLGSFSVGDNEYSFDASDLWTDLEKKLPCTEGLVDDLCDVGVTECSKVIVSPHSLRCEHPFKMFADIGKTAEITSASCVKDQWTFAINGTNGIEQISTSHQFKVICSLAPPKVPSTTSTTSSPIAQTTTKRKELQPDAQAAATDAPEKEKEKDHHHGIPWLWIGLGGALFVIIIIVNVVVCVLCFKRKNNTTKKQSKVTTPVQKNKKRKGGKEDSASAHPSSSELIPEAGKEGSKESASKESIKPPQQPTSEPAATEMNLDLLKTEKIN